MKDGIANIVTIATSLFWRARKGGGEQSWKIRIVSKLIFHNNVVSGRRTNEGMVNTMLQLDRFMLSMARN